MDAVTEPVRADVVDAIERVFADQSSDIKAEIKVQPGEDHDDDPVIFFTAVYPFTRTPIEPSAIFRVENQLQGAVRALGERRFVHTTYKFADRQRVASRP
jgi:hypothetical protein